MSISIYDETNDFAWISTSHSYSKNDIAKEGNYYYYALEDHLSGNVSLAQDYAAGKWGGIYLLNQLLIKPEFIWFPSYNNSINIQPKVKTIKFGDSYEQRIADGINNVMLQCDLSFDNRDIKEATAISHFLTMRGGSESFVFQAPGPYSRAVNKFIFVCDNFTINEIFYNNYSIRATFRQTVN